MKFPATTVLLSICAGLLGCAGGLQSDEPAPLIYRVNAPQLPGGDLLDADLVVAPPSTAPGLDSQLIATRWPGLRLDYYANARWAAPVPGMVQAAVIEALQGSRRLRSAQGDLGRFRATHVLMLEVQRFDADYTAGATPVAQVTLTATLGRQPERRVLASWSVATQEPASANRKTEVVAALDRAFGRAVTEIAIRSFETIGADLARQPQEP
jgi:ABC-type uncharacterized transport system auxiliary subunit